VPATNAAGRPPSGGKVPKSYVRLTQPLVRDAKGGELRQATWDEALDRTVAGLRAAMDRPRPAGGKVPIGIFSCSKSTNEVNYAAQKLARQVLGSNNIDSCNRT
jgi:predicted molibdopterin-dependent oxidoreductase YjgC